MPTISRSRTVNAAPDEVWRVVSDPDQLPRWWPQAKRVEDVSESAFTLVLGSPRGKAVRADYTLVEVEPLERLVWRHEVEESPFERILRESSTELRVEPEPGGDCQVSVTVRNRPRGLARFGALQLRRATARQVDEALAGLQSLFGPVEAA